MNNYSRSIRISKPAVESTKGMVTANHKVAASKGAEILAAGGNAMDAAVATSFMLGVCEPWMSGIGGCGQMLIYNAGEESVQSVDFGTVSPASLDPGDFPLANATGINLFNWPKVEGDLNVTGARSICVPTHVRAMEVAHALHGRLAWSDLIIPAAELAERGLAIDAYASLFIASAAADLKKNADAAAQFLDDDYLPPSIAWTANNEIHRPMPKLARTLRAIADEGAEIFYRGEIGRKMVDDVRALGGYLSIADLENYRPTIAPARQQAIADFMISVTPGLNAGPTLLPVLKQLESCAGNGDPGARDFLDLVSALHRETDKRLATMGDDGDQRGQACTSHFNVVDKHGNMVVVTQTLLSAFGSKVISGETGILLNNGALWFDPVPGRPNSLAAGKRPLSNMCPVIATGAGGGNEKIVFGIGASGGRKIMPAVAQIIWRTVLFGNSVEDAFHAPRIETSIRDQVTADYRLDPEILEFLARHHKLETAERHFYPYSFACPAAIWRQGNTNSGCTEVYSLWGDTVVEYHP